MFWFYFYRFHYAIETLRATPGVEDVTIFDGVAIEPTDESFRAAGAFLRDVRGADGVISIGGGSVMDTAKAANLLAVHGGTLRKVCLIFQFFQFDFLICDFFSFSNI